MESTEAKIIWEDDDKDMMLIWNAANKELIFIDNDKAIPIEPELNLTKRFVIIEYFGEFLPVHALAYVVKQIKGKL